VSISLTGSLLFEELAIIYAKQMRRTASSHAEILTGRLQQAMSRLLDVLSRGFMPRIAIIYRRGGILVIVIPLVFNEIETGRLMPELKSNLDTFLVFSSK
jgi:hypothetical protein